MRISFGVHLGILHLGMFQSSFNGFSGPPPWSRKANIIAWSWSFTKMEHPDIWWHHMELPVPCIHVGCTSISHLFYSKERSHFDDLSGWTIFLQWLLMVLWGNDGFRLDKKTRFKWPFFDPNCPAPNVGHPHLCLQRPSNRDAKPQVIPGANVVVAHGS